MTSMSRVSERTGESTDAPTRLAEALEATLRAVRLVQLRTRVLTAVAPLNRPDLLARATRDLDLPLEQLDSAQDNLVGPTADLALALGADSHTSLAMLIERIPSLGTVVPQWVDLARELLIECGRLAAMRAELGQTIDGSARAIEHELADTLGRGTAATYGSDGHRVTPAAPLVDRLL